MSKLERLSQASLFTNTPTFDEVEAGSSTADIDALIREMDALNSPKANYKSCITISNLARDAITSGKCSSELELFRYWELRLSYLLVANELNTAQHEARQLSAQIDRLVDEQAELSMPLQFRILLVRLKSGGPGVLLLNELINTLVWQLRKKRDNNGLRIVATAVSASLIAKREYTTFLTHANSIVSKINNIESSEHDLQFKNQLLFLSVVVSLMRGDWDLANDYFTLVADKQQIVCQLETCINQVGAKNNQEPVKLSDPSLDDLFKLIRQQLLTGKVLCCLCAYFEIEMHQAHDPLLHKLFLNNLYKKLCFE